jgi:hypothetical protein
MFNLFKLLHCINDIIKLAFAMDQPTHKKTFFLLNQSSFQQIKKKKLFLID